MSANKVEEGREILNNRRERVIAAITAYGSDWINVLREMKPEYGIVENYNAAIAMRMGRSSNLAVLQDLEHLSTELYIRLAAQKAEAEGRVAA